MRRNSHNHQPVSPSPGVNRSIWLVRVAKSVIVMALVLLLVLSAAILLLQTGAARSSLKAVLIAQIERHLNVTATIGDIRGNFISDVAIEDFTLADGTGPLISLEDLSVTYFLPLLIQKKIVINAINIRGAWVNLSQDETGVWNVSKLMKNQAATLPPEDTKASDIMVAVQRLTIEDSHFSIIDGKTMPPAKRQLDIATCRLRATYGQSLGIHIETAQFAVNRPMFQQLSLRGRATFDPDALLLDIESLGLESEKSSIELSGKASFRNKLPTFDFRLTCHRLSLAEIETALSLETALREDVTGFLAVQGNPARVTCQTDLQYRKTALSANGAIELDALPAIDITLNGKVRSFNPAILPIDAATDFTGDLNTDFKVHFKTADNFFASAGLVELDILPSDFGPTHIKGGRFEVDVIDGTLRLKDSHVASSLGDLKAAGQISNLSGSGSQAASLFVHLKHVVAEGFAPLQRAGVSGKANLDFEATATLPVALDFSKVRFALTVTPHDTPLSVSGVPLPVGAIHAVHATGFWQDDALSVESFQVETDFGGLTAMGNVTPGKAAGNITTTADLQDLNRLFGVMSPFLPAILNKQEISGKAKIEATIAGQFHSPYLTCRVLGNDIGLLGVFVKGIDAEGAWQGTVSEFDAKAAVALTSDIGTLNAKGRMDATNQTGSLSVEGDFTDIRQLYNAVLAIKPDLPRDLSPSGTVRINTMLGGSLQAPHITCQVGGTDVGAMGLFTKALIAGGEWQGGLSEHNATIALNMTGFEGSGNRFDQVDVKATLKNSNGTFETQIKHEKGHRMAATGRVDAAMDKATEIALDDLVFQPVGISGVDTLKNQGDIRLKWHEGLLDVTSFNMASGNTSITLAGQVETTGKQALKLMVNTKNLKLSDLPLPAKHDLLLDGILDIDMNAQGTLTAPELSGRFSLSNGHATLVKSGLTYEHMAANVLFENDAIRIQELLIKGDKEGHLKGTGYIKLRGGKPSIIDATLTGEDFYVPYQKAIYARVAPHLTLSGPIDAPMLQGDVRILESRINLDRMAPETPPEIEIIKAPADEPREHHIAEETKAPTFFQRLAANVAVKAPGNIWLKGQDINTEVAGDVLLKKESGKPFRLLGGLQTVRGIYYFRGRQFKVEKGAVNFIGLADPNPVIDIKATTKIDKVTIIILISGTAREITLTLDSDPQMDPSDIVSYLVFGKPTDGLKGGQAFNAEKAALGLTSGLLASELRSILGDVLFVDSFAMDSGEDGNGGSVSFGKYIRPNVFVIYRRGFSEEAQNRIEISYEYNPNIRIETQLGDDKNNGVDFFWEFDF